MSLRIKGLCDLGADRRVLASFKAWFGVFSFSARSQSLLVGIRVKRNGLNPILFDQLGWVVLRKLASV
jgi:hypothetical protein